MKLHEELHEASVAATGHHADLLRRAAEYVSACEGQEPVGYAIRNPFGNMITNRHGQVVLSNSKGSAYKSDYDAGAVDVPLYLHPSSPPSGMQLVPDVDELAQFIRLTDGNHSLGAGNLAENICEWMKSKAARG